MKLTAKGGYYYKDGRKIWMRSGWELKYAAYLDFLKRSGIIVDWDYEPVTFWFEGIKRGSVSYKPDFEQHNRDGSKTYVEVKGYMDSKSRTKIKRMAKYHPEVRLDVVTGERMRKLLKIF